MGGMTGAGAAGSPDASIVVIQPDGVTRAVPVTERLFVGRACFGIDDGHRLVIDGTNISRDHCQVRLDALRQRATLLDTSTNGTRLNGVLVQRSVPVALHDGDVIGIGSWRLEFRTSTYRGAPPQDGNLTIREIGEARACIVCGDLVDYTTLTERRGGPAVFGAMHALFDRLRILLQLHGGTLYDYVGDAFLAIWEETAMPDAAMRGLGFACAAAAEIETVAATLELRGEDGGPLAMGWAVTYGPIAMSSYAGALAGLLGDAVNVGFRLASMAGRQGRSSVLVAEDAVANGAMVAGLGPPEIVTVKGRQAPVTIRQLSAAVITGDPTPR